jgi:hypothetical protein
LVPESDPNVGAINDQILHVKEEIERIHKERQQFQTQLKEVSDIRTDTFLKFFDEVTQKL